MKAHITAIAAAAVLFSAMPAPAAGGHKAAKIVTTSDGLRYQDLVVGKGATPKAGQSVTVTYVGTLANGTKFDASADHGDGTFTFTLGVHQVIEGWDEGVATMRIGGTRKLIVPPALGYGPNGAGPIPPNATLTFVVQLLKAQ
ncbi:MAG: FKBP-type peptidyl-prolyl cis-trans isomerase [Capsulimonadaceae bacterium]